jgi:hypothetical protein
VLGVIILRRDSGWWDRDSWLETFCPCSEQITVTCHHKLPDRLEKSPQISHAVAALFFGLLIGRLPTRSSLQGTDTIL